MLQLHQTPLLPPSPSPSLQTTDQSQTAKETNIFALSNDYHKCLLYFESDANKDLKLNEASLKQIIISNEAISNKIQNVYVLHGNRRLLIVCKSDADVNQIEHLIVQLLEPFKEDGFDLFKRKCIPFNGNEGQQHQQPPLLLVAEVSDAQLKLINPDDKNTALKAIESKTGLKLKKVKKVFYFSGLLFQFVLLNELISEKSTIEFLQDINHESKQLEEDLKPIEVNTMNTQTPITTETEPNKQKTELDWYDMYNESIVRGHFMLKPKLVDSVDTSDFYYDVYIFEADLTDLNTDGIVNAANPNLHPGYVGDGISRRIREKSGKQMQDACKRIIRQDRNNVLLREGEVVFTKTYGKLKSKYVLHSVAPTWTKYLMSLNSSSSESSPSVSLSSPSSSTSSSSSSSNYNKQDQYQNQQQHISVNAESCEKFEITLEQSFSNLLRQAHDPKLQLTSLAIPVMSTSMGGAFDIPLELCAHTLYTQLVDFNLTNELNKNLKTICITSLECNTVRLLCDIFSNYTECYSESSWAIPVSPISRLLSIALEQKIQQQQQEEQQQQNQQPQLHTQKEEQQDKQHSLTQEPLENNQSETALDKLSSSLEDQSELELNQKPESETTSQENKLPIKKISVTILQSNNNSNNNNTNTNTNSNSNKSRIVSLSESENQQYYQQNRNSSSLISIKNNHQRHPRTLSNSSSNSSSFNSHSNYENNYLNKNRNVTNSSNSNEVGAECLFCQKENRNFNKLISCGSQNCQAVFCHNCITNYLSNQKTQKCPACRLFFDKNILNSLNKPANTTTNVHERLSFTNTNLLEYNHHASRNSVTEAKIFVKILEEPCDGYENFRTLIVTFEIDDGIQNDNHPKPGDPYKGTSKRAYLPEIREHREILSFYERALKSGRLFRIALSKVHGDFRVHLNQDVLLKTNQHGGGRFGYPDSYYIRDLLQMARSFK